MQWCTSCEFAYICQDNGDDDHDVVVDDEMG